MQGCWGSQVKVLDPSIQYLELYALTAAVLAWIDRFQNKFVTIFCDNQSIVAMVNNSTSKCINCMTLIRKIVLQCLIYNVTITAKFVPTHKNEIADSLLRFKNEKFRNLTVNRNMESEATPIPEAIWPMTKIWKCNNGI